VQGVRKVDAQAALAVGAIAVRVGAIDLNAGQQREPRGEEPLGQ
jgi:hypothetical protein